jgi:hypothetical protein
MTFNSNDQRTVPGILQGVTAQNIGAGTEAIANSTAVQAPGTNTSDDAAGRPGYLAVGQPGGNNAALLVPGGQYNTDNQIQTLGSPAGTAGGGGMYPATPSNPVPNPFISRAWSVQTSDVFIEFAYAAFNAAHGTAQTINPTTLADSNGGTGTFTVAVKEVNGVLTSTLPTGFSVAPSTGVITLTTGTAAGVTTIGLTVTDSSGRTAEASIVVTLS